MPKRTDIDSILIIGAGPIVIGQACEFDYSGTQAVRALRAEGYRIILVNSNPATIMTDPDMADATYIEPVTPEIVAKIIESERESHPDERMALLPTMGGQTALNTALSLRKMGVLDRFDVEMIGATAEAIDKAEDRDLFRKTMDKIGLETPKASFVNTSDLKQEFEQAYNQARKEIEETSVGVEKNEKLSAFEKEWMTGEFDRREKHRLQSQMQAFDASQITGLPAVVRPSFTLGGTGGGIAYTLDELYEIVLKGVEASPTNEVLVEESVLGWKEFEMEVVRDRDDNCIIICSIENIDPMGVHTGDSITVAPALTLTDKEYQLMRNASIAVLREIGIETGGSNVQFAVNPEDGRMVVIEMNPRVSRSSALASKATGFPIAKVAARLAVGYTLNELDNDITGGAMPASFEPSIDYVVTKIPRFTFEKFPGAKGVLSTSMQSVGEVMAIGRTFAESLQKAMRGLETGLNGFDEVTIEGLGQDDDKNVIRAALATPKPDRLLKVAQAMRAGASIETIFNYCKIDPWFLEQISQIIDMEERIRENGLPSSASGLRALKAMGFSDKRLAILLNCSPESVFQKRQELDVHPIFKRIDTCAAEFESPTAYMYSSYENYYDGAPQCEASPSSAKKIMILGGGPNRIGQGIEFDYCCCHAAISLSNAGYETIMVNCNPETVSTDYDTSDRLYFEPLTIEDVLEIARVEQSCGMLHGVIVQFGGQTPLKLAEQLHDAGVPILGTSVDALDLAEDRDRFKAFLHKLDLRQPANGTAQSVEEARAVVNEIGFPIVLRPSNVLGGRGMQIVHEESQFLKYVDEAVTLSDGDSLLLDRFLTDAMEVDVDALCDGETVVVCGIMQHIEEAGIHSGDSACALPHYSLDETLIDLLNEQTEKIAKELGVVGLMNVQYAIKDREIYVLEVNPRASRTVPFVAKTIGSPIATIASRVMAGEKLNTFQINKVMTDHFAVKEAVFPFAKFQDVDTILGPEMRSTGEVMGIDHRFEIAFAKAQMGAGSQIPENGTAFLSVRDHDKSRVGEIAQCLIGLGFEIVATGGTMRVLNEQGFACRRINKVLEGRPHIVDIIKNGGIQLVVNTTEGKKAIEDSRSLRRAALMQKIPYYTTFPGAIAAVKAMQVLREETLSVKSIQSYFQ